MYGLQCGDAMQIELQSGDVFLYIQILHPATKLAFTLNICVLANEAQRKVGSKLSAAKEHEVTPCEIYPKKECHLVGSC